MYNDDEHFSMDNNINMEQSLMSGIITHVETSMVDSYHTVDTESPTCSEPHIWMMVLYYSSSVVNIRRLRVAVATVTLKRNLISVHCAHFGS